jgi:Ca2+/Na+ antiporter
MPFRELLSNFGIGIMIGSLAVRILIEIFSVMKSRSINILDSAAKTNRDRINYYRFRKVVNGPVTIILVAAYLVGLFMLLPELNRYISSWLLVVFTSAFFVSGLFIIYKVRQSIRQEMENLEFFVNIDKYLHG